MLCVSVNGLSLLHYKIVKISDQINFVQSCKLNALYPLNLREIIRNVGWKNC